MFKNITETELLNYISPEKGIGARNVKFNRLLHRFYLILASV